MLAFDYSDKPKPWDSKIGGVLELTQAQYNKLHKATLSQEQRDELDQALTGPHSKREKTAAKYSFRSRVYYIRMAMVSDTLILPVEDLHCGCGGIAQLSIDLPAVDTDTDEAPNVLFSVRKWQATDNLGKQVPEQLNLVYLPSM